MTRKKIYFFDYGIFNPHKMKNVAMKVVKAIKEDKVLFKEEEKWEVRYDNGYPNVFYDPEHGKYRCYYSTFCKDSISLETPVEERKGKEYIPRSERIAALCYAESADGIIWQKPSLGLVEHDGDTDNNILGKHLHGTGIFYDEHEKDRKKRYKMLTRVDYGAGLYSLGVAFSSDGINFGEIIRCPNFFPKADTHNFVMFDKSINKYMMITRKFRDSMRIPCVSYSEDFINWSPIKEMIQSRGFGNQVYSVTAFKNGDYVLGLGSILHEGNMDEVDYDKVDVELLYSYGHNIWNYVEPGASFIERGQGGYQESFDSGCIFSSSPVEIDEKLYFYYMGGNGNHTGFREGHLARAYVENDRFAYIAPIEIEQEAFAYTNGFVFMEDDIYIDAEIEEGGYIEIGLYENSHVRLEDKVNLIKEGRRYKLSFDSKRGKKLTRLLIRFKKARIFSIEGTLYLFRHENESELLK